MTTGSARVGRPDDIDRVVEILTAAFLHDPLWGPAFPDLDRRAEGAPAYLRSLRPAGLHRKITAATGHEMTMMWRPAKGDRLVQQS
ncbi:hypothetical protein OWR29_34720 [Actinoplanes sp. Pm04-4]|uniref:Uncharacterized protein n=1 Tax=Paractinoplanes pyxinae TaxID=2997416 RepID=A0ABT4B9J7_9ACTN|nr:hypothetical protein [Actinoplanes pyxinae]MCY1143179.1 hypothetical protein [Actinoplanes pyxinae]